MKKANVGAVTGLALGLLDGASAWLSPSARPMFWIIVALAALKGLVTGIAVGWLGTKIGGLAKIVGLGAVVGAVLSFAAALPSGAYLEVVGPGTVIGLVVGLVVGRTSG